AAQPTETRYCGIWAATRIDSPAARALIREALNDGREEVRQVAMHSISLWRDKRAGLELQDCLKLDSAPNRRAAAEALGRIGDKSAVPALLAALAKENDSIVVHSLTYALIEIGDQHSTAAGLNWSKDKKASVHRAVLIALDQAGGCGVEVFPVAAALN